MAGVVVPSMPDPSDTHGTLAALARMEIEGAVRDGGVAMRLAFDARTVPEVAEIMGGGPATNLDGLAEYLAGRQDGRGPARRHRRASHGRGVLQHHVDHGDGASASRPFGEPARSWQTTRTVTQLVELFWKRSEKREAMRGKAP